MMPIVWLKSYEVKNGKKGKAMTSTIGASGDLLNEELRILFVNGVYHLLDLEIPKRAKVDFVGKYFSSQYSFHSDDYWDQKKLKVSDFTK